MDLRGAHLLDADLRSADLYGANLTSAHLYGANLTGADLSGTLFYETVLGRINMSVAKGLESCRHGGPSVIDHQTLALSGNLPLSFLRGCGLPDAFIEYLPSLLNQPIQFYSCFISYSIRDQEFAERLHADLQDKGVRCWFATKDVQGGKKLYEQIDQAIRLHNRLLLILFRHSMVSEWVKTEIAKARQKEIRQHRRVLFPISLESFEKIRQWECFDADTGKDSAREIREYFIPDFTCWKDHHAYKKAFDRLLRVLKADDPPSPTQSKE